MGGEWAVSLPGESRRNLSRYWFDGLFSAASDTIPINYLTLYLLALGVIFVAMSRIMLSMTYGRAGGSTDQSVILWDAESRRPRATLAGHMDAVSCIAFSRDGALLASADPAQSAGLSAAAAARDIDH